MGDDVHVYVYLIEEMDCGIEYFLKGKVIVQFGAERNQIGAWRKG